MAAKKAAFKTIPVGAKVSWRYRSAIGHGFVAGVHRMGATAATTMYSVRQTDHHVSRTGSREKDVVIHSGAALSRVKE